MLGMTSVTFRNKSIEEVIEITKQSPLTAIEWGGDAHVPDVNAAKRAAQLTKNAGLKIASYGSYYRVGKDSIQRFDEVLDVAKMLGAPIVRIWCGDIPSEDTPKERFLEYVRDIKEVAKRAAKDGIIIASEYHNGTYNDSPESALRLIESIGMANYRTYWQTLSFDERDVESLTKLLPYVETIHVFAWNRRGRRYSLRKHADKWRSIIELSRDSNVNYIMEFVKGDSDRRFLKDAETLADLYNGVYR